MKQPEPIEIRNVTKTYGEFRAVDDVSLTAAPGEFIAILGSSGSGKSTLLMIVAGFVAPDAGRLVFQGRDIVATPANRRGFGVVFQNYALFPHMSVLENVAFPLKVRRTPPAEAGRLAEQALATVKLEGFADRRIAALSGGQRQRVALARAIVFEPQVLLMDEPLSALDKTLREEMQIEIRELHDRLNITTLYVTHDQREALTMADRIAVMSHGRLLQVDTPEAIYRRPATEFVARFLGEAITLPVGEMAARLAGPLPAPPRDASAVMFRSEDVRLSAEGIAGTPLELGGRLRGVVFQGDSWLLQVDLADGQPLAARAQRAAADAVAGLAVGEAIRLFVDPRDIHFLRADQ